MWSKALINKKNICKLFVLNIENIANLLNQEKIIYHKTDVSLTYSNLSCISIIVANKLKNHIMNQNCNPLFN